jgi:phosphate transport system substrate-binding protein
VACIDEKQAGGIFWLSAGQTVRIMIEQRILAAILGIAFLAGCGPKGSGQLLLNGAGATFPYPIYSKWSFEYRKVDPTVSINYQSIGSGGGTEIHSGQDG